MMMNTVHTAVEIIPYQPEHQPYFEALNRAWIEKYFWMEERDVQSLQHPDETILKPGGAILVAQYDREIAGVAALKPYAEGVYEFTKMAVDERFRGKGIGQRLTEACVGKARSLGAHTVILYSSTKLIPAIALYRKLGFVEIPLDGTYERSDIKMKLVL